jgi:hypothetical protein
MPQQALQIKVWKQSRSGKELLDRVSGRPVDASKHLEMIYSWSTAEDVFGSISDPDASVRLRDALIENLSPDGPADKRSIEHLQSVVALMDEILADPEKSSWRTTVADRTLEDGTEVALRHHGLRSLRQHVVWICDTFRAMPAVSVSVR